MKTYCVFVLLFECVLVQTELFQICVIAPNDFLEGKLLIVIREILQTKPVVSRTPVCQVFMISQRFDLRNLVS